MDKGIKNDYSFEAMLDKQVDSVQCALRGFVGGDSLNFGGNFGAQKVKIGEQLFSTKSQSMNKDAILNYVGNFGDNGVKLDEHLYSVQSLDQDTSRQGKSGNYRRNVNDLNHGAGGQPSRSPAQSVAKNGQSWPSPQPKYSPGSNINSMTPPGSHSGQQIYGQGLNDNGGSVGRGQRQNSPSRPSVHWQKFNNSQGIVIGENYVPRGQRSQNPAQSAAVNRDYGGKVNPEMGGAENEQSYNSAQHNYGVDFDNNEPSDANYGSSYNVGHDRMRGPEQQRYAAQHVDGATSNGHNVIKEPEKPFEFSAQEVAAKRKEEDGRLAMPLKAAQQKTRFFAVKNATVDFVHVSRVDYANRICLYDDGHLLKQEAVKTVQRKSSSITMGKSLDRAPMTFGLSLIFMPCAARRFYIADVKLKLIQAEIKRRGYTPMMQEPVVPACAGRSGCSTGCSLDDSINNDTPAVRDMPAGGPFVQDTSNRKPQANLWHQAVPDSAGQYHGPPPTPASRMPTRAAPLSPHLSPNLSPHLSPHLSPIHSKASSPYNSVRWQFLYAGYPPGILDLPSSPPPAAHMVHSRNVPSTHPPEILQEPTSHVLQARGVPWSQFPSFSLDQAGSGPVQPLSASSARGGTPSVQSRSASAPFSHVPSAPVYTELPSVPPFEIPMATIYSEPPSYPFTHQRSPTFELPSDISEFPSDPSAYTPTMTGSPELPQRGVPFGGF